MGIIQQLSGMIEVELISADVPAALRGVTERDIPVYDAEFQSDLSVRFRIRRGDHRALVKLCKNRGDTLKIVRKDGVYWSFRMLSKRPVLLIGMLILLFGVLYLPSRVFFVRVEGNERVPTRLILAAAEECGIGFGAQRRDVRSERMKNALLEAVPELRWAGVNTYGCVAVISVRERAVNGTTGQEDVGVCSIVAARDGVIVSATVTDGNALCRVGQAVKAGEVLISGYTDCGICIQATKAEGEIFAQTTREMTVVTPSQYAFRGEQMDVKRNFSLIFGKKRINLWKDSGICEGSCGRMYEEYYITLPGGFQLPVCLAVEKHLCYEQVRSEVQQPEAQKHLTEFSEKYLRRQMIAGNILNRQQSVTLDGGIYRLKGNYVCVEMIGVIRREEIGDYNGKDN